MKLIQPWVYGFACLIALSTVSCNQQSEKKEKSQVSVNGKDLNPSLVEDKEVNDPTAKMLETSPPPPLYNVEVSITEEESSGRRLMTLALMNYTTKVLSVMAQ